ncbi:cyclic nucleotide-binding domain-containing protein [Archangium lansingense]|uniref:Cyclic nucleotide-binding domain-containing protein n=1 Tax=Archangium lansingense TaxID=2995310 RepID=A0ABT4AFT4_9BACT|nr:cyclic nucleotide-binding domain-containing protein [Archangium lansinium]MCY1080547.1 cyclic nucleotide-binding domain-containing protein [Archangium lansinium]
MRTASHWSRYPELLTSDHALLDRIGTVSDYPEGTTLITQGERPEALLLLLEGRAAILLGQVEVDRVARGDMLGEMSFLGNDPASASVVTLSASRVLRIPRAAVEQQAASDPGFAVRLYCGLALLIAERLRERNRRLFTQELTAADYAAAWTDTLTSLRSIQLPPIVERYVAAYEEVGHRGAFLWRWCWRGVDETTLPLVPEDWKEHLLSTKLLAIILNVLLDDLADQRGSEQLLESALSIPFHPQGRNAPPPEVPPEERRYFALIADLWHAIEARVRELRYHDAYRPLYVFDYQQVFNSMRYSVLTRNRPALHNLAENRAYSPHNMNMMVFATIDLMSAPVEASELGAIREGIWYAQSMGQIANMAATWRREVVARDFASRVFVQALDAGVLTAGELQNLPPEDITARIESSGMEERLLSEWTEQRRRLDVLMSRVRSFDMVRLVRGVDTLLGMHLAARGLI